MNLRNPMLSRRRALKTLVTLPSAAALAAASALTGCSTSTQAPRLLQWTSFTQAQQDIHRLVRSTHLQTQSQWSLAQTLAHCAQSIEYSLSGFPQPYSALFQRTAGTAAVHFFAWRGQMSHDLTEPIPGAPALNTALPLPTAVARIEAAIAAFEAHHQPLHPHFAYGALDKAQYEIAHVLHLANHLAQFDPKAA